MMTKRRIAALLDDPIKQANIMLVVSAIEEATKDLSEQDKKIALSLCGYGITNLEALTDMFIDETLKEFPASKQS